MQCLRIWFTIWLFAISVNNSVASPVDILSVDNKTEFGDLNTAESNQDGAVISERDNEVGYLRKEDEKGADAYQHFESFHDKDGDAYGYEKHEAYGKSNKGESLNDEKDKNEGSHYNYIQELGDKPKYQKYHGSIDDPGKNNYHYSYNSDDEDEAKPHSSSYKEANSDSSEKDDEDDIDNETENDGTDEEKTTNFSYKIVSDDYEDDANGDVNSKRSNDDKGYNFGHGDRNTKVDYNTKKSDYTAGDDEDDSEEENEDEDNEVKYKKIDNDEGKDKNKKSYSTYTTFSSQEGDDEDEDSDSNDKENLKEAIRHPKKDYDEHSDDEDTPKQVIRYRNSHPKKDYDDDSDAKDTPNAIQYKTSHPAKDYDAENDEKDTLTQAIEYKTHPAKNYDTDSDDKDTPTQAIRYQTVHTAKDHNADSDDTPRPTIQYHSSHPIKNYKQEQNEENDETDETDESGEDGGQIVVLKDVELHQAAEPPTHPRPTKPVTLVKEHRAGYTVHNEHPNSAPSKPQVVIQPSKPIEFVQDHPAEYKTEEDSDDKNSDDGKGHAGSVSKQLYEIYVTHDTGKSNGGGGDAKGSDEEGGSGKSENLVQLKNANNKANTNENGTYKVNVNYGQKQGLKKSGKKSNGKHKGILKKKKQNKKQSEKPHKYEVEEYIDNEEETKQPIIAGKESSPQHHRDNADYSNGQQFIYASEADSDAYYW